MFQEAKRPNTANDFGASRPEFRPPKGPVLVSEVPPFDAGNGDGVRVLKGFPSVEPCPLGSLPAIRFLSFLDLFNGFSRWVSELNPRKVSHNSQGMRKRTAQKAKPKGKRTFLKMEPFSFGMQRGPKEALFSTNQGNQATHPFVCFVCCCSGGPKGKPSISPQLRQFLYL